MEKPKILYISQEIEPYTPEPDRTQIAGICRSLPPGILEKGKEIRTFMPRFGNVNERRNQLHEVIRLSGLNIVIDDTDHPLIIKVASIQAARMQIYFIDNDEFFSRKASVNDENGQPFADNDERSIFFARGVLETAKKLRWAPDVIHLHGWFTMMSVVYLRLLMKDDPYFAQSRILVTLYDDAFPGQWTDMKKKVWVEGIDEKRLKKIDISDYKSLMKTAIDMADGIAIGSLDVDAELLEYAKASGKPVKEYAAQELMVDSYDAFYDELLAVPVGTKKK